MTENQFNENWGGEGHIPALTFTAKSALKSPRSERLIDSLRRIRGEDRPKIFVNHAVHDLQQIGGPAGRPNPDEVRDGGGKFKTKMTATLNLWYFRENRSRVLKIRK